jgi:hypothetical protein
VPLTLCLHTGHLALISSSTLCAQRTQQTRCPQWRKAARRRRRRQITHSSRSGMSEISPSIRSAESLSSSRWCSRLSFHSVYLRQFLQGHKVLGTSRWIPVAIDWWLERDFFQE